MAGKTYVVTAPLATPYREDGSRAYLYQGTEWPAGGLRDGETDRFLDLGYIGESGSAPVDDSADGDTPAAKKTTAKKS